MNRPVPSLAFFLDNSKIKEVDFTNPQWGNPGCGASEFLIVQVANGLATRGWNVTLYTTSTGKFPFVTKIMVVDNLVEACEISITEREFLIHRLEISARSLVYNQCKSKSGLRVIPWLQLTPSQDLARELSREDAVARVIAVGANQVTRLRDNPVYGKLVLINNPIANTREAEKMALKKDNQVVYLGALTSAKGFHILADQWGRIREKIPSATLKVIGSGALYDKNKTMGMNNLAESSYEKRIFKVLNPKDDSVEFLGTISDPELKSKIISQCKVGIVNPSGETETFCVAAAEIQSLGVPVVSARRFGLRDTIRHKRTGLLYRSRSGLNRAVVKLLNNEESRTQLGMNAFEWAKRYELEVVLDDWERLIESLEGKSSASLSHNNLASPKLQFALATINSVFTRMSQGKWPTLVEIAIIFRSSLKQLATRLKLDRS